LADGARVALAGLVLVRQRPGSAKGVIFATLEDETGVANIVVWPDCFERFRATLLKSCLLAVEGRIQKQGIVIHLVAEKLSDMTERLYELGRPRRPLAAPALAHADEAPRRPEPQPPPRHPRRANPMPRSRDFH
jgi:error-prone DNA polymerase